MIAAVEFVLDSGSKRKMQKNCGLNEDENLKFFRKVPPIKSNWLTENSEFINKFYWHYDRHWENISTINQKSLIQHAVQWQQTSLNIFSITRHKINVSKIQCKKCLEKSLWWLPKFLEATRNAKFYSSRRLRSVLCKCLREYNEK